MLTFLGFQTKFIFDLYGVPFHAVVFFILALIFYVKSALNELRREKMDSKLPKRHITSLSSPIDKNATISYK